MRYFCGVMKIALIGFGKMGQTIERIALSRGHQIVLRIDPCIAANASQALLQPVLDETGWQSDGWQQVDVAVEFTTPATAEQNVIRLLQRRISVLSGTTGWDTSEARRLSRQSDVPFLWSSNFSVGVNLFFALNERLAAMLKGYDYRPSITEIHHIHKKDRPSGTAKTLAETIERMMPSTGAVPIESVREGEVVGVHSVLWESPQDCIEIKHTAKSRDGFALGAVMAAEWLQGKKGPHTLKEVFEL